MQQTLPTDAKPRIDTDAVAYWRDYDLGDIVTAEIDLGEITDILREVTLTRTPDMGEQVVPSIGDPPDQPEIYRRVARLSRDVGQLKTRR
ncbi:Gp37-like protein [Nocardiopsis dassonvillei]|uniref:Gp37-like protein n=1 Tax=Nocardiopsis dassonvillei TaxID=2014 RepID=UPI00362E712A